MGGAMVGPPSIAMAWPGRSGRRARARQRQAEVPSGARVAGSGSRNSSSTAPPDSLWPRTRAGITRVSLAITMAPAGSRPASSVN